MISEDADEIMEELFKLLQNRFENILEKSMKDGECDFDYVHLLYCKCHKINPIRGGS